MKKLIKLFILFSSVVTLFSCSKKANDISDIKIERNDEFGGVSLHISKEELFDNGYEFGDSINVYFSNDKELIDIPLSDNYISRIGEAVLCCYQTYTYPHLAYNCGSDLFALFNLNDDVTLSIKLNKKLAYKEAHDALSLLYSNKREDFNSDEEFANFRPVNNIDKLKKDYFYRGASPVYNKNNRANTVKELINKNNISYIIDLSNTSEALASYHDSFKDTNDIWDNYYINNNVLSIKLDANYSSSAYSPQINKMVKFILNHEGKFCLHCNEGKDRTGFVAMLIEALLGGTPSNLLDDYMLTYKNYYNITKETNLKSYNAIIEYRFISMLNFISLSNKGMNVTSSDLSFGARSYLKLCVLSDEEIDNFIKKLSE